MPIYVRVSVNVPQVSGLFDYHLPVEMEGKVTPGCLVVIPFGTQRVQGVVLREVDQPEVLTTKAVEALLDPLPALNASQLKLAVWMAEEFLAPLSQCIDLMLPSGLAQQADTLFTLTGTKPGNGELSPLESRIFGALQKRNGALRGRQMDVVMGRVEWRPVAKKMVRMGVLHAQPVLPPPTVKPRFVRTAHLALPLEDARRLLQEHSRMQEPVRVRRQAVLEFLAGEVLPVNVAWVYAAARASLSDLQMLAETGIIILGETELWRDPLDSYETSPLEAPVLTHDQQFVWYQLQEMIQKIGMGEKTGICLLQGVTGSGKTELYMKAVAQVLERGKQAIVLVPEIALTPQIAQRFLSRFPGRVGLVHHMLSAGERYDTWRRARAGQLDVIIGARSALFTPLPDLGLIVLDECHDASYFQDDFPPAYHAVDTAIALGEFVQAAVILGSATPGVELRFRAEREKWLQCGLPRRLLAHLASVGERLEKLAHEVPLLPSEGDAAELPLPQVSIVDMRAELKTGNRSILSLELQNGLQQVLEKGEQALLFLNRRGAATYVFCRSCGKALRCPRCGLPLTFHTQPDALICHTCNYRRGMPHTCPECGSKAIRQLGAGTQTVEKAVAERFPEARLLRWDAETAKARGAHEIILAHFTNHRADILIGTQMLAKGLDLPLVTLVGVVLAEVGLNLPDFRASERTFQLLTQVAGRAGRSPLGGKVVLQTFQPDHPAIQYAARHDVEGFIQAEREERRKLGYPPFSSLVRMEFRHPRAEKAEQEAREMAVQVQRWLKEKEMGMTELIGPAPCYYARVGGIWRWQIILRGPDPRQALRGRELGGWRIQVDPSSLL